MFNLINLTLSALSAQLETSPVATPCNKPLKANPFISYRDPLTGRWLVVQTEPSAPPREATAPQLLVLPVTTRDPVTSLEAS
jgi:hypothetical protein